MKFPDEPDSLCTLSIIEPIVQEVFELDCKNKLEEDFLDNQEIEDKETKVFHVARISKKNFTVGQKVLLQHSKLMFFPGKLCSRWLGPHVITKIFANGAVEIQSLKTKNTFKVNDHQLKEYRKGFQTEPVEIMYLEDPIL
ncbi:hypothetical protein ACS0TY_036185 [Phlomoides rotata]